MEYAHDCLLKFLSVGLAQRSFEIWIFFNDICEYLKGIALTQSILHVTCSFNELQNIITLDHTLECDLIFA